MSKTTLEKKMEEEYCAAENTAVAPVSERTITDYLAAFGLANQLTEQETSQFVEVAKAYNLNPFKREIYCIPYGQGDIRRLSIITGYETYLKRAERTGLLDGWECTIEGQGTNMKAVATISRKGWSKPFKHEVWLTEYDQHNTMWKNKPRTMLKKVAIAQAFRLCFPEDMGGMPYTQDELPDEMTTLHMRDVTPAPTPGATTQEEMPRKTKATPEQIEEMTKLSKDFTQDELALFKDKYNGYPDEMIKAMRQARIEKFEAGTLRQDTAQPQKFRWATPEQRATLEQMEQEKPEPEPAKQTVGEPAPDMFQDDSTELYGDDPLANDKAHREEM